MEKITVKSDKEIKLMRAGGKKLAQVKARLIREIKEGVSASLVEKLATELIEQKGGKSSFKMVPGYRWSTCVNLDEGVVHGIPKKEVIFRDKDIVSVDLGIYYKGFHTDSAFSILVGLDKKKERFLQIGKQTLQKAISKAIPGNLVRDISYEIEKNLKDHKVNPIKSLTGHGVGKSLHERPFIPCFISGNPDEQVKLQEGMTLAIEIMYTEGKGDVVISKDGWTISTKDAKIAALFEETVAITSHGPVVLSA